MTAFIKRILAKNKLPEDWEISLLDELTQRGTGHTPSKSFPEYWNGGIKWVSLSDSKKLDRRYISRTDKEISTEGINNSSAVLLPKGTVILSRDAGVGMSSILGTDMAVSQHFIAWTCGKNLDNLYLYYWLQFMKQEFERMAVGSTIKTIGLGFFKKLQIMIPPLEDQKIISSILSRWDDAIETVELLITKKKKLNKSLMSKLLENDSLPQVLVSKVIKDSVAGEYGTAPNEGCPEDFELLNLLRSTNFTNEGWIDYSSVVTRCISKKKLLKVLLQKGDIVLEKSGGSPNQPVGRVVYFDSKDKFGYVNFLQKLVVNPKYDSRYVFYALKQYYESKKVLRYQQQTTGIINFQLNDFLKTAKIRVPDSLQEQQSISSILNNCDNQIQLLIKKKLLLEKQKKGLMQQLLTGKVRIT